MRSSSRPVVEALVGGGTSGLQCDRACGEIHDRDTSDWFALVL